MPKIAIIGGSGFSSEKFLKGFKQHIVKTMYGNVLLFVKDKVVYLYRHGKNRNIPPHRINHKANICALNLLGVEKIIGLNSVGSLNEKIKPGSIIVADDYVNFNPESFFEFELRFVVPEINDKLRKDIISGAKKAKITVKSKGTYVQMKGPRYETKAEIKIIKKYGDIVGMTMASEATLSKELGLPYASLCVVCNYANGIGKKKFDSGGLEKYQKKLQPKVEKIVKEIIKKNK
jgi:5'-methylthioadenosine phosphorylase